MNSTTDTAEVPVDFDPMAYNPRLWEGLPSQTNRYDDTNAGPRKNRYAKTGGLKVSEEHADIPVEPLRDGWCEYHHPVEGRPYFYNPALNIITEMYIRHEGVLNRLMEWHRIFTTLRDRVKPDASAFDVYLDCSGGTTCRYYMVDHANKTICWLRQRTTADLGISDVRNKLHLRALLHEEYWTHSEYMPKNENHLGASRAELQGALASSLLDHMTSEGSTSPFTTEECKAYLLGLDEAAESGHMLYLNWSIARIMGLLVHSRNVNVYGQYGARLDRGATVEGRPRRGPAYSYQSSLYGGGPAIHLNRLENLWVDRIIYTHHWRALLMEPDNVDGIYLQYMPKDKHNRVVWPQFLEHWRIICQEAERKKLLNVRPKGEMKRREREGMKPEKKERVKRRERGLAERRRELAEKRKWDLAERVEECTQEIRRPTKHEDGEAVERGKGRRTDTKTKGRQHDGAKRRDHTIKEIKSWPGDEEEIKAANEVREFYETEKPMPRLDYCAPPIGMPGSVHSDWITSETQPDETIDYFERIVKIKNYTSKLDHDRYPDQTKRGGSADVYRVATIDKTYVAVKCIFVQPDAGENKVLKARASRTRAKSSNTAKELEAWSRLRHKNILPLLGLARYKNSVAMVSSWMGLGNVVQFVNARPSENRYKLSAQLIEAVAYLHAQGTIHGDIKGGNVLMSDDGTPMLADLGLTMIAKSNLILSASNPGGGTMRWMAPELMTPEGCRSKEADVYALGMTILETLTGKPPFAEVENPLTIVVSVVCHRLTPQRPQCLSTHSRLENTFWQAMTRCWMYEPAQRATVTEVEELVACALKESEPHVGSEARVV